MDITSVLKELSTYKAVSGNEKNIAPHLKEMFEEYCSDVYIDKFFNVVGVKKGEKGKGRIMVTAHYDEIGLIVKGIDEHGFLKVTNMGGIDPRIMLAQEVTICGKSEIPGVIGAKPPHLLKPEEAKNAVKLENLYIDTGMSVEKVKENVSVGDIVVFGTNPSELQNGNLSAKSIDNRCGVAALLGIMEALTKVHYGPDVYFVATSQEETSAAGAAVIAYNIRPDAAIVIDACHGDMPDAPKDETYPLGKGPAIGIGPNLHKKLTQKLIDICSQENIPYQIDIEPGDTGTEAWVIQVARSGIPCILVSVPVRYMHTAIETVNIRDVRNSSRMAAAFIRDIDLESEGIECR